MIQTLIILVIVALILALIYYAVSIFVGGKPLQIIGIILALVFLLYVLRTFNLLPG
jgi:hypothetical protein